MLAQDMPDWEGVLVNDGSPDGSRDIGLPVRKDARFTLVDKENGACRARAMQASPRPRPYCRVLDSDDRFTPDACRVIVDAFEREDCDVLTFGANPYPLEAGYPWPNMCLARAMCRLRL
ncbi:MAG: glycosyltransferase [Collinsella sp.]